MLEQLERLPWVVALSNSILASIIISIAHYFGFFLLIGTAVFVNLRVLGVAGRHQNLKRTAEQLLPWSCVGFASALISGFLMFSFAADDYWAAGIFKCKVSVVLLAAIFSIFVHWGARRWDHLSSVPIWGKLLAFISIALWIGAILASTEVPAISGLG